MKSLNPNKDAAFLALPETRKAQLWHRFQSVGHCWRWQGSHSSRYGTFNIRGGMKIHAHRAAFLMTHGPISDGLLVCHRCNNPKCINPDHLKLGTQKDNMADRKRAGRHWLTKHPEKSSIHAWNATHSKLKPGDREEIKRLRSIGWTQQTIADLFKICRPLVSLILSGKK